MTGRDPLLRLWLLCTVLAAVIFAAIPSLDLWAARLFHAGGGFPAADWAPLARLRFLIWDASRLLLAVAAAGLVMARATGRPALWMPGRVWAFVLALYVLGPGLIVNGLLKTFWGRARPDQTVPFGGGAAFSPPLWPADQCAANCSFVSGEAAAAAALGISVAVMVRARRRDLPPAVALWALRGAVAVAAAGGLLRVAAGRHFLSDAVFAALIVAGVALALDRLPALSPRRAGAAGAAC
jgi:lipid A 4'-phosphatase